MPVSLAKQITDANAAIAAASQQIFAAFNGLTAENGTQIASNQLDASGMSASFFK